MSAVNSNLPSSPKTQCLSLNYVNWYLQQANSDLSKWCLSKLSEGRCVCVFVRCELSALAGSVEKTKVLVCIFLYVIIDLFSAAGSKRVQAQRAVRVRSLAHALSVLCFRRPAEEPWNPAQTSTPVQMLTSCTRPWRGWVSCLCAAVRVIWYFVGGGRVGLYYNSDQPMGGRSERSSSENNRRSNSRLSVLQLHPDHGHKYINRNETGVTASEHICSLVI